MTLRLLFDSDRIMGTSAYSKVAYELCTRSVKLGHKVAHIPMGNANRMGKQYFKGVLVYPSGRDPWNEDVILDAYVDWRADMVVTLKEPWVFRSMYKLAVNLVPYAIIDHSPVSPLITSKLHTAFRILVPSRFCMRELVQAGFSQDVIRYVPHGVRIDLYKPLDKKKSKEIFYLNPDHFVVGIVAMNRARKQIPRMLRVYKRFLELNPDVKSTLMLWTNVYPSKQPEQPTTGVADVGVHLLPEIGRLNLGEYVHWPDWKDVEKLGGLPEYDPQTGWDMPHLYNSFDVLLMTTGGEAFCLSPDTKIITENGIKKISEVSLSDRVLTHTGRLRRILKIYQRKHVGKLIKIRTWRTNQVIKITPEHPVLVVKRKKRKKSSPKWVQAKDIHKGDLLLLPVPKQHYKNVTFDLSSLPRVQSDEHFVWYSSQYSPRKKQITKLKLPRFVKLDEQFAKLLGWYIAEGDAGNLRGVGFSLAYNEKEYAQEIIELIRSIFKINPYQTIKKKSIRYIWSSSKILAQLFTTLCGRGAKNKKIPKELLYGELPLLKLCLDRAFKGDGCTIGNKYKRYTTASENLAFQFRVACLRLGYPVSVNKKIRLRRHHTSEVFKTIEYAMDITPEYVKSKHSRKSFRYNQDYIGFVVKDVTIEDYNGIVCNLEVEHDNTYCTANFVVHNCLPLIEAQACSVPVVTTEYAGAPEQVGAGLTVPYNDYDVINTPGTRYALCDVEKAAEALTKIMNADPQRLARKARAFALRYDWSRIISNYWAPFLNECEEELYPRYTKGGLTSWA